MSHYKPKTQKRQQKNRSRRQRRRHSRRNQRGGSTILSPSNYSNQNNAHFSGIGFTDPQGAVTGCTGSTSSAAALKGLDVFQTIGGLKTPVAAMKGGRGRILNKDMKPLHKSMDKAMKKLHKSMRRGGRSRAKVGGAPPGTIQAHQYAGASGGANANIAALTQHAAGANNLASNTPPPIPAPIQSNMVGGARTRHHRRRLRYKKSMARKSRSA